MAVIPNALIDILHTVWIRVSNLKRKLRLAGKEPRVCSTVLRVSADSLVEDLKNSILKAEPGMHEINLLTVRGEIVNRSQCTHQEFSKISKALSSWVIHIVSTTTGKTSLPPLLKS